MADGAIEQWYGSKRGSIPEGGLEVALLLVVVLRTHYGGELGDRGHAARALGLRGRPCRQCVTSLAADECANAARPFLPRGMESYVSVTTGEEGERRTTAVFFRSGERGIV